MKSLHQLVALHRHRLTQAEHDLREARRQLIACEDERDQHGVRLHAHRVYAKERERALYASLFDHVVKRNTVDLVKASLAALRRQEQQLQDALHQAEDQVTAARKRVHAAQRAYAQQVARTEKYLELSRRADATQQQMHQYKEELEIEERVPHR